MSRNCAYCILYLVTEDVSDFSGGRKHVVPGVVVSYFFIYTQMGRILFLGREITTGRLMHDWYNVQILHSF